MLQRIHNWADQFLKAKVAPMSNQLSEAFIRICMMPESLTIDDMFVGKEEMKRDFGVSVMLNRIARVGLDINGPSFVLLMMLCRSPGDMAMYATALRSWQVRNDNRKVTVHQMYLLFAAGFPTQDALDKVWDSQKDADSPAGNLIDCCTPETFLVQEPAAA
jgi:hypothetical protein